MDLYGKNPHSIGYIGVHIVKLSDYFHNITM